MLALQKSELVEQLEQIAETQSTTPEDLLDKVVSDYLVKAAQEKIRAENEAFEAIHQQLLHKYLDKYVAIHNGEVIDSDTDVRALHLRIRKKFGRTSVLLRQVVREKEQPDLVMRSPKLEPVVK